jgi:hypothetical protein
MHLPRQHLITKIEEVIRSIIRLERPSSSWSNLLWEQVEDLVEIVLRELGFIRHQSSRACANLARVCLSQLGVSKLLKVACTPFSTGRLKSTGSPWIGLKWRPWLHAQPVCFVIES